MPETPAITTPIAGANIDVVGHVVAPDRAPISVTLLSTWKTACGIADYTAGLANALAATVSRVDVAPINRRDLEFLSEDELARAWVRCAESIPACDVIHIQHEFGFFAGAFNFAASLRNLRRFIDIVRGRGIAVVMTIHTEPVFLRERGTTARGRARLLALRAQWAALTARISTDPGIQIVVHTRATRRVIVQSGVAPHSVSVIGQGVVPAAIPDAQTRAAARARLGITPQTTVLGIFGFLSAYKGYATAIEAMRRLGPDYLLLIAGGPHPDSSDSALEDVLRRIERHRALRDRVRVTGFLDAATLADHRAAVDCWLAPYNASPAVSSSAAVSWAIATGRPVIASAIPPFREVSDEYGCMTLVTPERPRELAFAIERNATNAEPAHAARVAAFVADSTWAQRAADHAALYTRLSAR